MKAAVTTRYGLPEVVEVREVPTPTPTDNEVLVRVRASSVCFGDRILRSGPFLIRLMSGFRPRHPILGVDLAGTVEAVGPGVRRFAPRDAVYGARGRKIGNVAALIGNQTEHPPVVPAHIRSEQLDSSQPAL